MDRIDTPEERAEKTMNILKALKIISDLEARVAELEAERDRLKAEAAKWERAARKLAARLSLARGLPDHGLSEDGWIVYATTAPQAQEEEG